jgi:hypothetical protein
MQSPATYQVGRDAPALIRKSQSSLEFLLIIAFMTLVFVSFFALANSRLAESRDARVYRTAEDIAALVKSQVVLVSQVNDGFSTEFVIPQVVDGSPYSITIIDNRELVVVYKDYEHVEFLPVNVSGTLVFGNNVLSKRRGELFLNS